MRMAVAEVAHHGVGELAVYLDVPLAGDRVPLAAVRRAGVAKQFAEKVGEEVGQDLLFLEGVGATRGNQLPPMPQLRTLRRHVGGQLERRQVRSEDIGAEQRLGFNGHGGEPP